jgi:hypothetical protein
VDEEYLKRIIEKAATEQLRELHRRFVRLFQRTFVLSDVISKANISESAKARAIEELKKMEKILGEQYHMGVEQKCSDIIDDLRREDDTFYADAQRCVDFIYFLFNQYFRTKGLQHRTASIYLDTIHNARGLSRPISMRPMSRLRVLLKELTIVSPSSATIRIPPLSPPISR